MTFRSMLLPLGAWRSRVSCWKLPELVALGKSSALQLRCCQGLLPFLSVTWGPQD